MYVWVCMHVWAFVYVWVWSNKIYIIEHSENNLAFQAGLNETYTHISSIYINICVCVKERARETSQTGI